MARDEQDGAVNPASRPRTARCFWISLAVAVLVGAVATLLLWNGPGDSRLEPVPSWIPLPSSAQVLISCNPNREVVMLPEGPVYYLRFRSGGSPEDVLNKFTKALEANGLYPAREAGIISKEDLEYRRKSPPSLRSCLLPDVDAVGGLTLSLTDGATRILHVFAIPENSGTLVELVEETQL